MQLLWNYRLAPGCCHRCRSSAGNRPIIDLCREDPDKVLRQAVYLCEDCVTAAYTMLNTDKVLIGKQTLADKEGEITALSNEVARLMEEARAWDIRLASAVASTRDEVDA